MKKILLSLLSITLFNTSSFALTQKIRLDMGPIHLRGQSVIPIKKEIRYQKGFGVKNWKLKSVKVSAKSKKGMGRVSIFAGGRQGISTTVPGTPAQFASSQEGFSGLSLAVPRQFRGQRNPFQIWSQGNIKIKEIFLTLKKNLNARLLDIQRLPLYTVAKFKAGKLVGSTKTIFPKGAIKGLALTGLKGKVKINKVVVVKHNGQKIILNELQGSIKSGKTKGLIFPRSLQGGIVKIKITATSNNVFGSRGKLAIKLAH